MNEETCVCQDCGFIFFNLSNATCPVCNSTNVEIEIEQIPQDDEN